jgi:hypothetical protein
MTYKKKFGNNEMKPAVYLNAKYGRQKNIPITSQSLCFLMEILT